MDTDRFYFAHPTELHTSFAGLETEEEGDLRARVRSFAWEEFEHLRDETDQLRSCADLMPVLGNAGFLETLIEGGAEDSEHRLVESSIIAQELGAVIPSLAAMRAISSTFVGMPIQHFGTPEQQSEILGPILTGQETTALAITEPAAGSDLGGISTFARRADPDWRITGTKRHISGAVEASYILLIARTDTEAPLNRALTAFLVPTSADGLDVDATRGYMGVSGLSHARVSLDDVDIPDDLRLGGVGEGLRLLQFILTIERVDIAARALGCATRAFEEARAYASERIQFGAPLKKKQAVSHAIASMRVDIDSGRLLVLRAARLYDHTRMTHGPERASEICDKEAAIAKLSCANRGFAVCDQAMQICGGIGYQQGSAVEAMFRDCRVFRFGGGTDEIMRHVVQRGEFESVTTRET